MEEASKADRSGGSEGEVQEVAPANTLEPPRVHTYKEHVKDVLTLAGPIIVSEFFQNTLPVIDIAFVGNLPDKNDLAAAALATVWFNLWNATMTGFNTAIDTFLAQAHGAKEFRGYGLWTATGLVVVMFVTVLMSGVVAICGPMMRLFGQDETLAEQAGHFSYRLIPGLFPYYAFKVLVKYLQSQRIVMPGVWIGIFANGFNVLFNWALIYELDMGLYGAPWATTITRFVELFMVIGYIWWNRNAEQFISTWPTISREMFKRETLGPFVKLAISGALSISAVAWSFEIATILSGLIGVVELDAQTITMSINAFLFLSFPFAIGIAASIRVGQWIGESSPRNAQRTSLVSFILSAFIQAVLAVTLLVTRDWLGNVFSSDEEVAQLVSDLIPICSLFMMGDAVQATVGGVMRGLGRQRLVLSLNILAFWILAIPSGALLTFVGNVGVAGLWWGYVIGIYSAGIIGIVLLRFRIEWEHEAENAAKRLSTLSTMHLQSPPNVEQVQAGDVDKGVETSANEAVRPDDGASEEEGETVDL